MLGQLGDVVNKPIVYALQSVIFSFIISITSIFLTLSQSLLSTVLSDNFITVAFTHNEFVDAGLEITKNLGNIIIIIASVIIALATILRVKEYQAQKTIPILILVALLINFAPMICGVIIDGSNITIGYFLKGGDLDPQIVQTPLEQLGKIIGSYSIGEDERLARGMVYSAYNIFAGLVFFLFALLFAARYIALWILVIISPLAFACYILKFTRKYFALWWNQFFQWSIIGIPAAFTIYLANKIMEITNKGGLGSLAPTGELINYTVLYQYFIPLAFLVGGFFMSLQTGATGANIITGFFEKEVKAGAKGVGSFARKTAGAAAGAAGAAAVGTFTRPQDDERGQPMGRQERGKQAIGRFLERAHLVRPGFYEEGRRTKSDVDNEKKRLKDLSYARQQEIMDRRALTARERDAQTALYELWGENGQLREQDRPQLNTMLRRGVNESTILKARPDWTADVRGRNIAEQVQGRTPGQFNKEAQIESLRNIDVIISMDARKAKEIMTKGSQDKRQILIDWATVNTQRFNDLETRAAQFNQEEVTQLRNTLETIRTNEILND